MIILPKLLPVLHSFPHIYTTAPCLFLLSSPCQCCVPIWLGFSNLVCAATIFVSSDISSPDEFRRPCFFEVFCQFWLSQSLPYVFHQHVSPRLQKSGSLKWRLVSLFKWCVQKHKPNDKISEFVCILTFT